AACPLNAAQAAPVKKPERSASPEAIQPSTIDFSAPERATRSANRGSCATDTGAAGATGGRAAASATAGSASIRATARAIPQDMACLSQRTGGQSASGWKSSLTPSRIELFSA